MNDENKGGAAGFWAAVAAEAWCWASAGFVAIVLFALATAVVGGLLGKLGVWRDALRAFLFGV